MLMVLGTTWLKRSIEPSFGTVTRVTESVVGLADDYSDHEKRPCPRAGSYLCRQALLAKYREERIAANQVDAGAPLWRRSPLEASSKC